MGLIHGTKLGVTGSLSNTNSVFGFADLSAASPHGLDQLSAACEIATFGRGNERVHDETYRKAGKLDKENFACKVDEEVPKILDAIRPVLFTNGQEKTNIRTEFYKLNIYGGSIFLHSAVFFADAVLRRGRLLQVTSGYAAEQVHVWLARHRLSNPSTGLHP
jgi:hypothetical protein